MHSSRRCARVNVKVLVIILMGVASLGGSAFALHKYRKHHMAAKALADGRAALERKDWPAATKHLKTYLSKFPDDLEMLERYAEAHLAVDPPEPERLASAIGAYRRLLRKQPDNEQVFRKLTRLYMTTGGSDDAAYLCRQRLEAHPSDAFAKLWFARAKIVDQKTDEARTALDELIAAHPTEVNAYVTLAGLTLSGGAHGSETRALELLNRAVQANPDSADALAHRARIRRVTAKSAAGAREDAWRDLDAAERSRISDPATTLLLADEWMNWGQLDRARVMVEAAQRSDVSAEGASDLEPATFALLRLNAEAQLALFGTDAAKGIVIAERGLGELSGHRRTLFLPTATRLFLAAGRVADARAAFDEFVRQRDTEASTVRDESTRMIAAQLLMAEGKSAEAIAELEPAAENFHDPIGWRMLADAYRRTGRAREAVDALHKLVERVPNDPRSRLELARALRGTDWTKARAHAEKAQSLAPSVDAQLVMLECDAALSAGQADEAAVKRRTIQSLQKLRAANPTSAAPSLLLASLLTAVGELDAAEADLRACAANCDQPMPSLLRLVDVLLKQQKPDEAEAVCVDAIARFPESAAPRLRLADLYVAAEQTDKAIETVTTATEQLAGTERRAAQLSLARSQIAAGDELRAQTVLKDVTQSDPADIQSRLMLLSLPAVRADRALTQSLISEVRAAEGDRGVRWKLQQALMLLDDPNWRTSEKQIGDLLTDCRRMDPNSATAAFAEALFCERTGRLDQAEAGYRAALHADPGAIRTADRLAALLQQQGRNGEALRLIQSLPTDSERLKARRISLALAQGDYEQAISELENRLALKSDSVDVRVNLAKLQLIHTRDTARAEKLLAEAEALEPQSVDVLQARVQALLHANRTDDALKLLDERIARFPSAAVHRLRGEFLESLRRFDDAEKDYRAMAVLDRADNQAQAALASFYERVGKLNEAITAWDDAVQRDPNDAGLRRKLAAALIRSRDESNRNRGRELIATLRAQSPDDAELHRLTADLLMTDGSGESLADAQRALDEAIAADPSDVEAHLRRIALAGQRGDWEAARQACARALAANRNNVELRFAQIAVELEAGGARVAQGLAESLSADRPSDAGLAARLSAMFLASGDSAGAAPFAARALQQSPSSEGANLAHINLLVAQGKSPAAADHLRRFTQSESGAQSAAAWLRLARLLTGQRDFAEADHCIAKAQTVLTEHAPAVAERIFWLAAQDRYADITALVSTQQASGSTTAHARVLAAAGDALFASGREPHVREARMINEELTRVAPDEPRGYVGLAQCAYRLGDKDSAINAYRRVLAQVDPTHAQAANDLAWLLAENGDHGAMDEAERIAAKALSRHPRDAHLLHTHGIILMRQGKHEPARRDFERCIAVSESKPSTQAKAHLKLAAALAALKHDAALARQSIERAAALDAQHNVLTTEDRAELAQLREALR